MRSGHGIKLYLTPDISEITELVIIIFLMSKYLIALYVDYCYTF